MLHIARQPRNQVRLRSRTLNQCVADLGGRSPAPCFGLIQRGVADAAHERGDCGGAQEVGTRALGVD
jgi:hypothetical protein